ncbi:MAG: MTH1187 family thiamine-binding protein [Syntrophobacteraceae bacterium]
MAVVEVSIVPIGVAGTSLSSYVATALEVLRESPVQYELTSMGTILSGDLDEILAVVRRMHESLFEKGAPRVLTQIKIDDRRDRIGSPRQKVQSVLDKLQG